MKHRDYVARRELLDDDFKALHERNRLIYEFQLALIRARQEAGITQKELAARLGTTQSAVANWENGTNVPKLDTVQRLARVPNVDFAITPGLILLHTPSSYLFSD